MKKILFTFLFVIASITILIPHERFYASASTSSSKIVMEVSTGRVLYEDNAYERKFMASTTKILTAITIIENCNLDEIITVSNQTVGVEGSSIYLEAGEKLSIKNLLYGLMLRSGNDCAETLAVHCSKTIKDFSILMNETANKIGEKNSNFVNPQGLHDDNHYTTAYDLAKISCYAMKNQTFREIAGTKSVKIPFTTRGYDRYLVNKNKMLKEFDGSTGIKTGFTKKAGRCLVSSCMRDGMELVCVVLNCPPMFEESKTLLTNCFNRYQMYKLYESDYIVAFIPVKDEKEKCAVCVKEDIILPLSYDESQVIKITYEYPEELEKPIKKDQEIGFIKIYAANNLLFTQKIYTINNILN